MISLISEAEAPSGILVGESSLFLAGESSIFLFGFTDMKVELDRTLSALRTLIFDFGLYL